LNVKVYFIFITTSEFSGDNLITVNDQINIYSE